MRYVRILVVFLTVVTAGIFGYYKLGVLSQRDQEAPVITAESDEITVSVDATDEDLLQGLTAEDNKDGDVTDSLIVESVGKFSSVGKREVTYCAFDGAGNVGTYKRTLYYSDYTSPEFSFSGPLRYNVNNAVYGLSDKVTAEDCIDGNITGQIKFKYGENSYYYNEGDQLISFQVSNSCGETISIEVYQENLSPEDYVLPYPVLSDYVVYTTVGEKLTLSSYAVGVCRNGYVENFGDSERYSGSDITREGEVDYDTPGTYRVIYTLHSDETGSGTESQGSVSLYVVVREAE